MVKKSISLADQIKAEIASQLPKVETGIAVALPNTTEQKMQAICLLAQSIKSLAAALESTNTQVSITGCTVWNTNTGISVTTRDK